MGVQVPRGAPIKNKKANPKWLAFFLRIRREIRNQGILETSAANAPLGETAVRAENLLEKLKSGECFPP